MSGSIDAISPSEPLPRESQGLLGKSQTQIIHLRPRVKIEPACFFFFQCSFLLAKERTMNFSTCPAPSCCTAPSLSC